VQASGMMAKLKKVLTGQVVKELENLAKNDADKYLAFWKEFGGYLKQGVASNPAETEKILPLLRFKTNLQPETWSSLEDYTGRIKAAQTVIYYITGDDPKSVLRSPHLDYFQAQGTEVLLLTEPIDAFMLMGLHKYKDYELKNVAQADTTPPAPPADAKDEPERIPEGDFAGLVDKFKAELGERVTDVRASQRLSQSVARLVDPDGSLDPQLQRVYKYLGKEYEVPKKILELNPSHPILKNLLALEAGSELQNLIIAQIYDSALLVEGLHPDPSSMAPRVQQLMELALGKK
jgi:molecular chaperone HtpG